MGPYLIAFDPLDGSSNIDINVSIGSIFSVLPCVRPKRDCVEADFLQPGRNQVAAGYCMYGPQTQLVLTLGRGVVMFTLDPTTGTFILTREDVRVERAAKEFAINCSNMRHWEAPVKRYDGPSGDSGRRPRKGPPARRGLLGRRRRSGARDGLPPRKRRRDGKVSAHPSHLRPALKSRSAEKADKKARAPEPADGPSAVQIGS